MLVDEAWGGTNDGSMATGYQETSMVVEMSHPFLSGHLRDASPAAGGKFGVSVSTYLKEAGGHEAWVDLVPDRSGQTQWVACGVPDQ